MPTSEPAIRTPDPLAYIIKLGRCLALADHLGDISEDFERAWSALGLGSLPEAEGGEPIDPQDPDGATYDCGDLIVSEFERVHGVTGLWRKEAFTVELSWHDDFGESHRVTCEVKADTPMDAARVAYLEHVGGSYAEAVVSGERFELEPVASVLVTRAEDGPSPGILPAPRG